MKRAQGETRELVRQGFIDDPEISDYALGAALGITAEAVRYHRHGLGLANAWIRRALGSEAHRAVYCKTCCTTRTLQKCRVTILCPCGALLQMAP